MGMDLGEQNYEISGRIKINGMVMNKELKLVTISQRDGMSAKIWFLYTK